MADFDIYDISDFDFDLNECILWQYEQADCLKSLIGQKNEWYNDNLISFWNGIISDFLNIQTATDNGLNLWGKILKVPRVYNVYGENITLSTELYRRLILGKLSLIHSNGTASEINKYLNFIFSEHTTSTAFAATVRDCYDMSVVYILNFEPSDEETALLYSRTFLPTPAGVEDKMYIMPESSVFGFYGSGFQPFNHGVFWDGRYL